MTKNGHQQLQKLLHHLITVERPAVVSAIAEARDHGDLSENAEYDAAKEQQAHLEGRIQNIQDKLARAQVIEPATMRIDKIAFGATVTLTDSNTLEEVVYKIVGEDEADIKKGMISIYSPLARALVGKKEGDEVALKAPGGLREYEVENIEYI